MNPLESQIITILEGQRMCYLATTNQSFVDNAMVAYYSEGFDLYFGSFRDTLKCRNIDENPHVAIGVGKLQIHGSAQLIAAESPEHQEYVAKYLTKFPNYQFYFELQNNELYRIKPLVIWLYDSSKGTMHRDRLIIDQDYYHQLQPYETPEKFQKKNVVSSQT